MRHIENTELKLDLIPFVILKILKGNKNKPIKGKILIQKISFLILKNFSKIFDEFDFVAHYYGPYSAAIDIMIEDLEYLKFLKRPAKEEFEISQLGKEALEISDSIYKSKDLEVFEEIIENIKESFLNFKTNQILAFIYKSFPEYIDPSIAAEKIDYEKTFLQCYEEGKLGISKIAELLGWSYQKTYDYIHKNARRIHV